MFLLILFSCDICICFEHKNPHTKKYNQWDDCGFRPSIVPRIIAANIGQNIWCTINLIYSIGLNPGSWQTSLGLGSMPWYSAQILICFIAYIFHFLYFSVGLVGNFAGLPSCTVPSATAHCNQNEAGHQTIKAPSMPCLGEVGPCKHSLTFMPQDWWNRQKKWMKSVSMGSYQYKNQVNGEFFWIPVSDLTVFQPRI